ncbi:MAG: hypothetical protein IPK82_36285 [Polyangiaceae bacterium]|nr:hypothetical protein [Polyangiaceae bacterium]
MVETGPQAKQRGAFYRWLFCSVIGLTAMGCEKPDSPRSSSQETMMVTQDGLEFSANLTADDSRMTIHYTVKNKGDLTVHLMNRVVAYKDGLPTFSADNAYIYTESSSLVVEKAIPPVPVGLAPTELIVPYSTPLYPGTTFEESVDVELPVKENRAYQRRRATDETFTVEVVLFRLGYVTAPQGSIETTETVGDQKVVLFRAPPGTLARPEVIEISVPVTHRQTGKPSSVKVFVPSL